MKILKIVLIVLSLLIVSTITNVIYEFLWFRVKKFVLNKRTYNTFAEPIYGEDNILFLESSCMLNDDGKPGIPLKPRQACAVESAARSNPQAKIYVLHTCHVGPSDVNLSSEYVQRTLEYSNVHIWPLNLPKLLIGTPLDPWPEANQLPSNILELVHAKDIIKFVALWKYAGTFFDLDFIVMKSLGKMKNFASVEYFKSFSTGVLNLAPDILGTNVASKCLVHLNNLLYGAVSGHDRVEVIIRVLLNMCKKAFASQLAPGSCQGFTILNASTFPSIPCRQWFSNFDVNFSRNIMKNINDSLALHILDSTSQGLTVKGNYSAQYSFLVQKYCPEVYSHYKK